MAQKHSNEPVDEFKPRKLFSYPKYWAECFDTAPYLPMSRAEMDELGWDSCDIIIVTADAYVDHPSFGMALVGRLLEGEGRCKRLVRHAGMLECPAGARPALRVDLQQFGRDVMDPLLRLAPRAGPLVTAKAVQRHRLVIDARVAAHQAERGHRYEEMCLFRVFDAEEFAVLAAHIQCLQAEVAADPVFEVYHRRADREFGQVADRAVPTFGAAASTLPLRCASAEQR